LQHLHAVGIGYRSAIAEWTRANLDRFDQLERQWRIALLASADGECCADTGVA
jgi:hypothetical protein